MVSSGTYTNRSGIYVPILKTHNEAQAHCKSVYGTDLITIANADEQAYLQSKCQPSQADGSPCTGSNGWPDVLNCACHIGLNDENIEGTYQWYVGSSNYRNYASGEPNNYFGVEDCFAMFGDLPAWTGSALGWNDGEWWDLDCNSGVRLPFFCQNNEDDCLTNVNDCLNVDQNNANGHRFQICQQGLTCRQYITCNPGYYGNIMNCSADEIWNDNHHVCINENDSTWDRTCVLDDGLCTQWKAASAYDGDPCEENISQICNDICPTGTCPDQWCQYDCDQTPAPAP